MNYSNSTTPLAASGTIIVGPLLADVADTITGTCFSDQSGTIFVEQSFDQINWDYSVSIAYTGGTGVGFSESIYAPNIRVRYVNGSTLQTAFRLYAIALYRGR